MANSFKEPLLGAGVGAAGGAALGAGIGLVGGPFAPVTVPAGALIGAGVGGAGGFFGGLFSQNTNNKAEMSVQNAIATVAGQKTQEAVTQRASILSRLPGATAENVGAAASAPVVTQTTTDLQTPADWKKYIIPGLITVAAVGLVFVLVKR